MDKEKIRKFFDIRTAIYLLILGLLVGFLVGFISGLHHFSATPYMATKDVELNNTNYYQAAPIVSVSCTGHPYIDNGNSYLYISVWGNQSGSQTFTECQIKYLAVNTHLR